MKLWSVLSDAEGIIKERYERNLKESKMVESYLSSQTSPFNRFKKFLGNEPRNVETDIFTKEERTVLQNRLGELLNWQRDIKDKYK